MKSLREGGKDDASRLTYAFRRGVAARALASGARPAALTLLERQRRRTAAADAFGFTRAEIAARRPPATPRDELAAWTVVARVLLNLDETITKE